MLDKPPDRGRSLAEDRTVKIFDSAVAHGEERTEVGTDGNWEAL